jgi:nitrite reductase/ring-hydroxylating ferredoxin subunit
MAIVRSRRSTESDVRPAADTESALALGRVDALARGKRHVLSTAWGELLIIARRKGFTVVENRCPHRGASLDDADISRHHITCPLHAYRYSLNDGVPVSNTRCLRGNAGQLKVLGTRVVDGWLYATSPAHSEGVT